MPHYDNPMQGFEIIALDNGVNVHAMLVREGCTGSVSCAMEWYVARGSDFLGMPGVNIHFSDEEMETVYRAVKAVRNVRIKAQRKERKKNGS